MRWQWSETKKGEGEAFITIDHLGPAFQSFVDGGCLTQMMMTTRGCMASVTES